MRRGAVCEALLDPVEGSEQDGTRPVVTVRRDAVNAASRAVLAVPCITDREPGVDPSHVLLHAADGGLPVDSVALGKQVRALFKTQLVRRRGMLSPLVLRQIGRALLIALHLMIGR